MTPLLPGHENMGGMTAATRWQVENARLVNPDGSEQSGGLIFNGHLIERVLHPGEAEDGLAALDLKGCLVFPALINSHDSLNETCSPLPAGNGYRSWREVQGALAHWPPSPEKSLSIEHRYRLGGYKNLLGGVTFVVDHTPHALRSPFHKVLPVDLLQSFGIAHSAVASLPWGRGIALEYAEAAEAGRPFIIRIAEGLDQDAAESLTRLTREGGLGENTVLVHGLALSESDLDQIAEAGAAVVWCPSANQHLYSRTLPLAGILNRGIPVCIGTSGSVNGSKSMLYELRAAALAWENLMGAPADADTLFSMVTHTPARVFRLPKRGSVAAGKHADLLVLQSRGASAPTTLISSAPSDIRLLTKNGLPVFADAQPDFERLFKDLRVPYERIDLRGGEPKLVVQGLRAQMTQIYSVIGQHYDFDFLPFC